MERVFNFSAGPAVIDESVLQKAASELMSYPGKGMSVLEMSHRTSMFMDIYNQAVSLLRDVMDIPETHEVLFLHGGATMQFSAVPLNLMHGHNVADYLDTGNFAHLAAEEAKKYGTVNIVASSRADNYTNIPDLSAVSFTPNADYVHITTNNTIYGTRFVSLPDTGDVPLVADASSNILSEPMDVRRFGVIYAGAQKNIGPAGVAVLLVRRDLLGKANPICPKVLDWALQAKNESMVNTPNTFAIYMIKLVCEWMLQNGGVSDFHARNREKANLLYDYLDSSKLFKNPVQPEYRSLMNVVFVTGDEAKDDAFCKFCAQNGIVNIKGHRNVGGMRASIYNAMPLAGVQKLVETMARFEKQV